MKDFRQLLTRLRQFGGTRLLWRYYELGALWIGIKEFTRCTIHRRSFKHIYPHITKRIDSFLIEKYASSHLSSAHNTSTSAQKIYFCWLQGLENAPELVISCYNSIKKFFPEQEIIVIDKNTYSDYITLPQFILEKYSKGVIPHALFSDILRIELLLKYGGTWIDSTVLCTSRLYWKEIQKSELFLFRYFRKGKEIGISNWFIHAKANNVVLKELRESLYNYWKEENCVLNYYMFHLFYSVAASHHHDIIDHMPLGNSFANIQLGERLTQDYDKQWWSQLVSKVNFHKLNYRISAKNNPESYYQFIIKGECVV